MQLVSTHTNFHLINLRKKEDKKIAIVRGSAELAAAFNEVEAAVLKVYDWQAHVMFSSQSA